MSWNVIEHTTIYKERGLYSAHPTLVRAPDGDLLTFFHRSPDHQYSRHSHPLFDVRMCRSSDGGETWSPPRYVTSDPLGGILDFGTHTLADGSIFLHASTVELNPLKTFPQSAWNSHPGIPFWVRSRDNGNSWTAPARFPMLPDAVWGNPASHSGVCRSSLLQMPDGRLLMPSKATEDPDGKMPFFGMMRVSADLGETWSYGGRVVEDPISHFSEPTIHRTPSGRIIVLFRCHPVPGSTASDVHLAIVESNDGGDTWEPWRPTTIMGCPGHMLGLKDGRILVTVGTRWEGQWGCLGRVLDPEGTDMEMAPDFIIRSDSHDPDCGYPWAVELEDGRVLVVYYYVYQDGVRGIEGTVIEEAE